MPRPERRVHKYHRLKEKSFSSQLEPKRSEQEHYLFFLKAFSLVCSDAWRKSGGKKCELFNHWPCTINILLTLYLWGPPFDWSKHLIPQATIYTSTDFTLTSDIEHWIDHTVSNIISSKWNINEASHGVWSAWASTAQYHISFVLSQSFKSLIEMK